MVHFRPFVVPPLGGIAPPTTLHLHGSFPVVCSPACLYAIEWPDLDEHIGIARLLAGRRRGDRRGGITKPGSVASVC